MKTTERCYAMSTRKKVKADLNKTGLFSSEVAKSLEGTQIDKFHWHGGTGFAAEDANALADRVRFRKIEITGLSNEANGSDRIIDGKPIQTKYFDNSHATLNAAFDSTAGNYRYQGQMLEVPNDQYDDCVRLMREKISKGKVPGIIDPKEAHRIIKKGCITYRQARNIARAGNIDSLVYDVKSQAVSTSYLFAISFSIDFARRKWSGEENGEAIKGALHTAIISGSSALVTGVIASQILRSHTAAVGTIVVRGGIKSVASTTIGRKVTQSIAAASMGRAIYGAAAINHVSKLLRSNIITSAILTVVVTTPDIFRASVVKNISWGQFSKNFLINVAGVAAGTGGWMGGAAAGAAVGSIFPVAGTVVGGVVGGVLGALLGGTVGAVGAKEGLGLLIEDDAKKMLKIVQSTVEELANDYLLSDNEITELSKRLQSLLEANWLKKMFKAGSDSSRKAFAYNRLDVVCLEIVKARKTIALPKPYDVESKISEITKGVSIENVGG